MQVFKLIEGATVILVQRGLFKECRVWSRDGTNHLYAGVSGSYIRLRGRFETSHTSTRWEQLAGAPFLTMTSKGGEPYLPAAEAVS